MTDTDSQELRRVLGALALNREPGWHFAGHFFDVSFDEMGAGDVSLSILPDAHCELGDGQAHMAAVSILADLAMSAAMRWHADFAMRMATVTMSLQFTGAPRRGLLQARGYFDGFIQAPSGLCDQGLCRAEIRAGDDLVCTATGSFLAMRRHTGMASMQLRKRADSEPVQALLPEALTDAERAVYERALKALEPGPGSFIERFWGLQPQRLDDGAVCRLENGPQVGNRVGHTQGGITVALAALTANAALGEKWQLAGISSWYVRPGTGPALQARATVTHRGTHTAVVDVDVTNENGDTVLRALTNHISRG
ncbi:PaaI family thioesterase [Candidimonas humi]|uniref:Hotdog domain-containing protein n=1 Tax=Candidimonas humi TaxID=683355 RepID=A0ABV8NVZ8_9BURK|nr:PaaI family thioesterase [Candidimonas humi]MBV6303550.1 PaaI family thioesterase [Candidimonas humi]